MKKALILTALVSSLIVSSTVFAAPQQGGFVSDPSQATSTSTPHRLPLTTVEQAKTQADDTHVHLKGHISEALGNDHYLFKDNSGSMTVEIKQKRWHGRTVSPADEIEIWGKVDRDGQKIEVDVKRLFKTADRQKMQEMRKNRHQK